MNPLPTHGPLSCSICFSHCNAPETANGWRLINDPGYWGATDPVVLVLGQSKGKTQRDVFDGGDPTFDKAALVRFVHAIKTNT